MGHNSGSFLIKGVIYRIEVNAIKTHEFLQRGGFSGPHSGPLDGILSFLLYFRDFDDIFINRWHFFCLSRLFSE